MIRIKQITPPKVNVRNLGTRDVWYILNEYEFTDLRVQIAKEHAEGWQVLEKGRWYNIDSNGRLPEWTDGLFDTLDNLYSQLL